MACGAVMLQSTMDEHGVGSRANQDSMSGEDKGSSAVLVNRMLADPRNNPWAPFGLVLVMYAPSNYQYDYQVTYTIPHTFHTSLRKLRLEVPILGPIAHGPFRSSGAIRER